MSLLAYEKADIVTCLYDRAKALQIELGCPEEKIRVTPNGIKVDTFEGIPGKSEEEEAYINAGAVLRVTPIKDVKTMIQAFAFAKKSEMCIRDRFQRDGDRSEEPEGSGQRPFCAVKGS